jgi:2-dehydropantoate 2-reductase
VLLLIAFTPAPVSKSKCCCAPTLIIILYTFIQQQAAFNNCFQKKQSKKQQSIAMATTKIIIAGIGGVGGWFGGMLAKHFYNHQQIEISFVARGAHLAEIKKNGLTVIKRDTTFIARPALATDNPAEIGIADLVILCTKSYDLEAVIEQLRPCINPDTVILPLLNGVDSRERIEKMLPGSLVADGCVYIVSRLKRAGVIENTGNTQSLYFGLDDFKSDKLAFFETLFKEAGIEATLSANISTIIWEKFIFISPTATATSYFDRCIGEVIVNDESLATIAALIEEVKQVAAAKQVTVSANITENVLNRLNTLPFETTSSMHSDFKNGKGQTELDSLTGYVISKGQKYNVATPTYVKLYTALKKKAGV